MTLFAATEALVQQMLDVGLRATLDPRRVDPPCVLVPRPSAEPVGNGCANMIAQWDVQLIGRGPDQPNAFRQLSELVDAVTSTFGPLIVAIEPDTYPLNEAAEAPSYRVSLQTTT